MLAVELLPRLEEEAKKRQGERNDLKTNIPQKIAESESRHKAAKLTGTNRTYVSELKKIKDTELEVFEQIKTGEKKLSRVEGWAEVITNDWRKTIQGIIKTGQDLIRAKEDLDHGREYSCQRKLTCFCISRVNFVLFSRKPRELGRFFQIVINSSEIYRNCLITC